MIMMMTIMVDEFEPQAADQKSGTIMFISLPSPSPLKISIAKNRKRTNRIVTSFAVVEEVDHLFLLVLEESLSSEPRYRAIFFKDIFVSLFCLLVYHFAARISLPFYILRTISSYTCKSNYLVELLDSTSTQKPRNVKSSGIQPSTLKIK